MALTPGTTGVKQKDYRVYLALASTTGLQNAITEYLGANTKTKMTAITGLMKEVGELRKDSIDLALDNGDSVEGNTVGEIVMNKQGSFTAELLNTTAENIAALEALDGASCAVVIEEKDTHLVGAATCKTTYLLNNLVVNYTEKVTGGDIARSTISINRKTPTASSFRHLADINQAT